MAQAADFWQGYHLAHLGWLDSPRHRTVIIQRLMCPRAMVVVDIAPQDPTRVLLIQYNDVIEAVATDGPDEPLAVRAVVTVTESLS